MTIRQFIILVFYFIVLVSHKLYAQNDLQVGFAQINITPPVGMRLCGTFDEVPSVGVHDSLYVRAFIFSQGETKFALAGCDLAMVSPAVGKGVRQNVKALGLSESNVIIHASETHNGPDYFGEFRAVFHKRNIEKYGYDPAEPIDYQSFLIEQIGKAIKKAESNRQPIQLAYAEGKAKGLSFYRRFRMKDGSIDWNPGKNNPDIIESLGPTDNSVPILAMYTTNNTSRPIALWTSFAMHLAVLDDKLYGADYPYYLGKKLKELWSGAIFTHFLQPPCNEVNHLDVNNPDPQMGHKWAKVIGDSLATTIVSSINKKEPVNVALKVISDTLTLDTQEFSEEEVAKQRDIWYTANRNQTPFLEVVHAAKVSGIYGRHEGKPIQVLIQAFQISSEIALIALPSEVSIEFGLQIKKKSPYRHTLLVQLSNDWIGYISPERIFNEGNYEAVVSKIKSGEGERMVEKSIQLLKELKNN